uniref:SLC41A/MgtE integral membrane domain-containing protein n=3 Tax=Wuchereria bancrofti TaxID=6293 RepID=A0AAF5PVX5_WUCBA
MAKKRRSESVLSESVVSTSDQPQETTRGGGREKAILISVLRQTLLPFFIAGLGQICTGLFFERAQHWWFFLYVPEAFILVPALLGLKGNLEVTYASRFCTLSNAGQTNKASEIFFIARFNLCLIEMQAIVLSFFAALLSSAISLINCDFKQSHITVILSSGIYTASLSSFVVGFVMIAIVVSSYRYGIDPDNIAAPLIATFSDFITLIMLIGVGMLMLHIYIHKLYILNIAVLICLFCTTPFLAYYAAKEPRTRSILRDGWFAVTAAIIVGCCSGLLLQSAIVVFPGIAALHPLIAGLAGNRVSVQSSRLATALHLSEYSLGRLPAGTTIWTFLNPLRFLCLRHLDSKVAFLLIVTAIPYNFLFVVVVIFTAKNVNFSWIFVGSYVMAAFVQGLLLFYLCQVTVYGLWWFRMDPDNSSVPVLTSVGDLLGIGLLYTVFLFLHRFAPSTVLYQQYQTMNITRQCGIDF